MGLVLVLQLAIAHIGIEKHTQLGSKWGLWYNFSNSDMDLLREEVGVGVAVEQGQYPARGRRSVLIEKKLEKESLPSHEDRNRGIGYTGLLNGLVSYTGISPVLDRQ